MAADSKSGAPQGVVGSNPMPSALTDDDNSCQTPCHQGVFACAETRAANPPNCHRMTPGDIERQELVHAVVHAEIAEPPK